MLDKLLNSNNIVNKENLLKDYKQEKISLEKTKITENKSKN